MRYGIDHEVLVDGVITKPTLNLSPGSTRITDEVNDADRATLPESRPAGFVR